MKKKILLVFGTRPEAIKMAPLVKELQKYPEQFDTKVCVTAQHREMLDQVLDLFEIVPDYDLNIMKAGQDLYDVTSRVLVGMREVLKIAKPDVVLVHGDTSTSTAAALAAFYQQTPVGHIEAGLRTYNIYSPWPEEMNRQLTGRLATWHFAPTPLSCQNLLREGVKEENIHITGNTVIDALFWVIDKMKKDETLEKAITEKLVNFGLPFEKLQAWDTHSSVQSPKHLITNKRKLVLITGHRRENFGQGFLNICEAIKELAEQFPDVDFVYPMHLNPNVRHAITAVFGDLREIRNNSCDSDTQNVYFIEPLDYLPFVYLMNLSYLVLTDSGGIQEEAPGLGKPVLVMRDTTERPEAIDAGTVKLVGTDKEIIIREVSRLINEPAAYGVMSKANNPYGDGEACPRIMEVINKTI
ncbi:non-hydrolyzing UDP-N-acetylglucosamine 2-epimerase [Gaoshiqia sp. Z1-71]|uniref:non-hydrolyzing UDP-N-acetylglucosamine 2-epimerase n=1 Tax=Gaoshiqia hydrogeniformans TaxID=3290090 RepID=UPI003BF7A26B